MSLFGNKSFNSSFGNVSDIASVANPNKDIEVSNPSEDSVSSLSFSPASLPNNFLVAGSWDNSVRFWEITAQATTVPKAQQSMGGPILDTCWHDDGSKVFMASCDKQVKCWDLASNQTVQVAEHQAPVKTCRWVQAPNYSALMTASWDKTLKFWDTRSSAPMMSIDLPERAYCADVDYPMAVVGTAGRGIIIYQLDGQPQEFKRVESQLKFQHRCVSIFRDKKSAPTGFALGSREGRVAITYLNPPTPKDNFTFKCHRSAGVTNGFQEIYAVNDIAFHPQHMTLATVGGDGKFSFWDKDARTKLKTSEACEQPITKCAFNKDGNIFAYAVSYDWSKGHEHYVAQKKNYIFLRSCFDELRPRQK